MRKQATVPATLHSPADLTYEITLLRAMQNRCGDFADKVRMQRTVAQCSAPCC
jgi:hypothetical protein